MSWYELTTLDVARYNRRRIQTYTIPRYQRFKSCNGDTTSQSFQVRATLTMHYRPLTHHTIHYPSAGGFLMALWFQITTLEISRYSCGPGFEGRGGDKRRHELEADHLHPDLLSRQVLQRGQRRACG